MHISFPLKAYWHACLIINSFSTMIYHSSLFLLPLKTYKRAIFLRKFEFNLVILSSAMIEVFHILPLTSWSPLFFAFLVSVVRYSAREVPPSNFLEYRHDHKVFNLESNLPNEEGSLTYYSSILIMHILLYHLP